MRPRSRFLTPKRALVGVLAAVSAVCFATTPAMADAGNANACSAPLLTQPFLSWNDSNYYTLMPGESVGSFDGTGWALSGGASIVSTTLAGGTTGNVLDLPSGSRAVSPPMCVASNYQTARTMIRDVVGSEGVSFAVSYAWWNIWSHRQYTGQVNGQGTDWTLSAPVNLQPSSTPGWQVVKFTLTAGGQSSDFQLYNFYVDPYAKG